MLILSLPDLASSFDLMHYHSFVSPKRYMVMKATCSFRELCVASKYYSMSYIKFSKSSTFRTLLNGLGLRTCTLNGVNFEVADPP